VCVWGDAFLAAGFSLLRKDKVEKTRCPPHTEGVILRLTHRGRHVILSLRVSGSKHTREVHHSSASHSGPTLFTQFRKINFWRTDTRRSDISAPLSVVEEHFLNLQKSSHRSSRDASDDEEERRRVNRRSQGEGDILSGDESVGGQADPLEVLVRDLDHIGTLWGS